MAYCYKPLHDEKQSQTQTEPLNFIINSENQIVPGESIKKDISFEWLHCRILSADSKVKTISHYNSPAIIYWLYSGIETGEL